MDDDQVPGRFRRYPYGPGYSRVVAPSAAIIAGVGAVILHAGGLGRSSDDTLFFWLGVGLAVLGVAGLVVARVFAKRGL